METYIYKAVNSDGEVVEAVKDAVSEQALIIALQQEGYMPLSIAPAKSRPFYWLFSGTMSSRLPQKDVALFTRELATLLESGLPLDRSLVILMELVEGNEKLHRLINQVLEKVKSGASLADALESQTGVFSGFYLNMIRAGELGGSLESVLARLAVYLEQSRELKETVTTALIYPAFLVVMALGSLFALLTFVVPQFVSMFESAGKELPVSTQVVIAIAGWLQSYWWALFLAAAALYSYMRFQLADSEKRKTWDRRFLDWPIVGDIILNMETANFSRTLGTLLGNGVSILTALTIVQETVRNRV
ncbi:MAG: type II secretion system F family protein, partial [Gammaproteobacteria bacterium]